MPGHAARRIVVTGRVQGVGYRPFVYRTAHRIGLTGWVLNGSGKVFIHAEGTPAQITALEEALTELAPPLALPGLETSEETPPKGYQTFEIRTSEAAERPEIHIPPDLFTCNDCLQELTDPEERRYHYPFINCTQCGPRYTLITAMPYDRPNTSMAGFPLCDDCRREYESPLDRRFHAQPLACEKCGPRLRFGSNQQWTIGNDEALAAAVAALAQGQILAVKGVGGYHLVCDAANESAVMELRQRKRRPHKPLAVMFPIAGEDGLAAVREQTDPTDTESKQILDPARPIVLVRKSGQYSLSAAISDTLAEIGVFLPYSPLHHLLLGAFGAPLVATSGNLSGEPVLTDAKTAEQRLSAICDGFLHHNRPIVRPADDPVVRIIAGHPQLIRPGRGIAPMELELPGTETLEPTIALGGHMKNTIALAWDRRVVISPHIGELDSPRSLDVFSQVIDDLQALYGVEAKRLIGDAHPGYASSRWGQRQGMSFTPVFHHHAHASALAGEHADIGTWLVFTWDGVGFGEDGTLWGGEALAGRPGNWRRSASIRPLRLVGGDRAGREPWRSAAAMLWDCGDQAELSVEGLALARAAWRAGTGVHTSSAVGRLFDAAAALVTGRHYASFEGQGPMELEAIARGEAEAVPLPLTRDANGLPRTDWGPLLPVLQDTQRDTALRAAIFHESLAEALLQQALYLREHTSFEAVGLTGGVFQNRRLTESAIRRLRQAGFDVRMPVQVPANDAGLCFGQVVETLGVRATIRAQDGVNRNA